MLGNRCLLKPKNLKIYRMKRVLFFVVALMFAISSKATDVKVQTISVGEVTVKCADEAWKIDVKVAEKGGREEISVEMTAPQALTPPQLSVEFSTPQLDAHHLWNSDNMCYTELRPVWGAAYSSSLAREMPIYSFINTNNRSRLTIAAAEAVRKVDAQLGLREEGALFVGKLRFFVEPEAPLAHYKTTILLDKRDIFWADAVRESAQWITAQNRFEACQVPEAAFAPLYSTWYQFHQQITDHDIEAECREAVKLGMGTIIVDDGWQTDNNDRGYAYCGDWVVAPSRIKDIKAHIKRVQAMGMKYMMWYSVPFVGEYSKAYKRFEGKYLRIKNEGGLVGVLDPRFPEVREHICSIYEKALREWELDGFKLDFIDSFRTDGPDPAVAQNYAGRDIKSISEAVNVLMKEVSRRLQAIKPDILIEFRQRYVGPAIRQYGNMFRAMDCPGDMRTNRARIANLRLTSGTTAVHADMLEWNLNEKPEVVARHILSAMYGVVQYSAMLREIPESHLQVMKHWIAFSQEHRKALLHGAFRPYHPEAYFPVLEGESDKERIITVYQAGMAVNAGAADREVYLLNATGVEGLVVELQEKPRKAEFFDMYGNSVAGNKLAKGVQRVAVPTSGYVKLTF